jgi:hypothetical protein
LLHVAPSWTLLEVTLSMQNVESGTNSIKNQRLRQVVSRPVHLRVYLKICLRKQAGIRNPKQLALAEVSLSDWGRGLRQAMLDDIV